MCRHFGEMTGARNDFHCCLVFPISDVTFARQVESFIWKWMSNHICNFFFQMVVNAQLFTTWKSEKKNNDHPIMKFLNCWEKDEKNFVQNLKGKMWFTVHKLVKYHSVHGTGWGSLVTHTESGPSLTTFITKIVRSRAGLELYSFFLGSCSGAGVLCFITSVTSVRS